MIEEWRWVNGYEGRYEISNLGVVRCVKSRTHKHEPRVMEGEVYTQSQTQYRRVLLSKPKKKFLVHRLVAMAFIPEVSGKLLVNHKDNNGLNNVVSNLEWCTQSENLIHAQSQGRLTKAQSTGGKVTSEINKLKAVETAKSMVGKTFSSWTALEYEEAEVGSVIRDHLICECTCGTRLSIYYKHLESGATKHCRACGKKELSLQIMETIKSDYLGKVIGTWKFTGNSVGDASSTKSLKLEACCTECGWVDKIPYSKISIGVKQCINCKQLR